MRSLTMLVASLALVATLAACSSGASPTSTPGGGGGGGAGAVTIIDFAFQPADLSVKIGDTVTWTNTGNTAHTVKWDDGSTPESDRLTNGGAAYERTFDTAGTFTYVCGIHGSMKGSITVAP